MKTQRSKDIIPYASLLKHELRVPSSASNLPLRVTLLPIHCVTLRFVSTSEVLVHSGN